MSAHAKSNLETAPDMRADVRILDSLRGFGSENTTRHLMMCGLFALAGILALAIDVPLSQAMFSEKSLHWLHGFLESIEPFGQPPAVVAVSLGVVMCGGVRRGAGFRIAAGALLSGLAVLLLKLCVARIRPRHFNFEGTVLDTFSGILPGSSGSHLQSWPSGHTATAVGFCLALSAVFPKGRWLFRVLAVLVALQRIESGAHYLSDTLFAASVAYIVHLAVFGAGPLGRWFDGVEAQWARFDMRWSQKSPHA
jgi:membrane-associated phospholipid phosphatase